MKRLLTQLKSASTSILLRGPKAILKQLSTTILQKTLTVHQKLYLINKSGAFCHLWNIIKFRLASLMKWKEWESNRDRFRLIYFISLNGNTIRFIQSLSFFFHLFFLKVLDYGEDNNNDTRNWYVLNHFINNHIKIWRDGLKCSFAISFKACHELTASIVEVC